jgi:DNA polymerase-3 subunit alpha (Gram-positive type)
MTKLFEKLMDQIQLPLELRQTAAFQAADIEQVVVHSESKRWHMFLKFPAILPFADYFTLRSQLEQAFSDIASIDLTIHADQPEITDDILNAYYPMIFSEPVCDEGGFQALYKNYRLTYDGKFVYVVTGELAQIKFFEDRYYPVMSDLFESYGFGKLKFRSKTDASISQELADQHEKEKAETFKQAENQIVEMQQQGPAPTNSSPAAPRQRQAQGSNGGPKVSGGEALLGREIKGELTQMVNVINEEPNIIFEGYVFAATHNEFTSRATGKTSHQLEIKMTDYTSSFIVTRWGRKDEELEAFDKVKAGMWLRVKGNVQMDPYKKEMIMNARDVMIVKAPIGFERRDAMPDDEKRVEFHAHTNMSTMDAIPDVSDLVKKAAQFGHKAIAITDHAGLQSFPHAHSAGKKNGVKILYGVEANLVEDRVPIAYNPTHDDLHNSTYVVFDVETTGLSAVYNNLIQIAASKMHKGNIIAEFDEFIDPGHPLSDFTTELTGITDDHVRGSKPLAQVLQEFQAFCEGSILVAHNASFDVGFMNMNYERNGLSIIGQPVIDTLELSRNLHPEFKRHGLGPLTKRYGVALDHHHMANYDAEATGRLLFIFLNEVKETHGLHYVDELNTQLVSPDSYKQARVKHATIYATTQDGLKNLFKLVSYSNVNYFAGVPRIPKSVLQEHREGLIVGTGCDEGELFDAIMTKSFDQALEVAKFYDFIEVMPPAIYRPLIAKENVKDELELQKIIKDIIRVGDTLGKPVLATGNVHYLEPRDAIFREIIVRSQGQGAMINRPIGNGEHAMPAPLPEAHFRTTAEMLDEFSFLDPEVARQIVITNPNALADSFDVLTPVRDDLYTPYIEGTEETVAKMTYEKAMELYGNPLPDIVDLRIEKELKSIIGNGFAVIYLISQMLVKRSNDRGYLVGSRGSVGSSFVATMMGITEVNPLAPHYYCSECQWSHFYDDGTYGSGFDMPDKDCPNCGAKLHKDGHDIPFETFLGFKGDKVPDIDLNFSGADQPFAHLDVRDIFGDDYAYRAGTIGTVADKTAFGFVKGYERDYGKYYRGAEVERLAIGATGVKRTTGQHPGGIIVIPNYMDVYDFTPVAFPAEDVTATWKTTHFDFHAIHDNILKLDILGHVDPTVIRTLQNLSGIDPKTIPMDDPDVYRLFQGPEVLGVTPDKIFSKTGTLGIPEMGTPFVRGMLEETKPSTFAELLQISGLSHGTDVWLGNAQELIKAGTADLKTVIGCRDDIMVYLIHRGLDESMSFKIMERVRKGLWLKIDEAERNEYIDAMRANNVPEWYIESCGKIKYMFPKAHAAAYVLMALRVAWFKVHHPIFYYCAWFSHRANAFDLKLMAGGVDGVKARMREIKEKGYDATGPETALYDTLELTNEMLERGFKFGKLDLYRSKATDFIIEGDTLIPPFAAMDGLGENVAKQIVAAREDGEFLSKTELRKRAGVSQTLVEKLDEMGVLGNMPEDNQLSLFDDLF